MHISSFFWFFLRSWVSHPIDQYQNANPKVMPLHELKKKVQFQMTQDLIRHLKMLCMSVLSLSGGMESELKCCSSLLALGGGPVKCSSMNSALNQECHGTVVNYWRTKYLKWSRGISHMSAIFNFDFSIWINCPFKILHFDPNSIWIKHLVAEI